VTITPGERKELANLPIVRDFPNVFSNELPSLPPHKKIDFTIELLPGTQPISRTSCRIVTNELKELKVQVQDLLDKGFIRSSTSPWGVPVLFVRKKDGSM